MAPKFKLNTVFANSNSSTVATPGGANNNLLKRREMSVENLPTYHMAYMGNSEGVGEGHGTHPVPGVEGGMRRSTSWYDGFFGCLKPVWTLMGKTGKPSANGPSSEGTCLCT